MVPPVSGMHIQRDGTERWLVIDNKSPDQVWPQIRRFWQEQGFLLVVDSRDKGVMETDWNETHPQISDGLIRNTLSKATGNSLCDRRAQQVPHASRSGAERRHVRVREPEGHARSADGREQRFEPVASPPERSRARKRIPEAPDGVARAGRFASGVGRAARHASSLDKAAPRRRGAQGRQAGGGDHSGAERHAVRARRRIQNDTVPEASSAELTLPEAYDRAWLRVGIALDRSNFTVDDRDRAKGIYFVRYVDPKDMTSAEQGFWSQVFHGKKEKVAKQYAVNVRAITEAANARVDHRRQGPGRFLAASAADHGAACRSDRLNPVGASADTKNPPRFRGGFFLWRGEWHADCALLRQ